MNSIKLTTFIIIATFLTFSCGKKKADTEPSPNNLEENGHEVIMKESSDIEKNIDDIIADLHMEIKKLKAEVDYQYESMSKIEAQSQLWTNPFSIYNKEIVLDNGTSIFGKIVYQDQDLMKVETLIGQLIIDRNSIVRVVNQIGAYNKFGDGVSETSKDEDASSGINLIQKRLQSQSANLVLVGDITEEKDGSGNTILSGEVKNAGNKRADFSKIIFTFRINWQGDTKTLTAFIKGVTNTFDTGISSDNSILPHAVGNFKLIIPQSFGTFIGYNYDIDWSQYDG